MDKIRVDFHHYLLLMSIAGQDLAEASATEIVNTGRFINPGPTFIHVLEDAVPSSVDGAVTFVTSYVLTLNGICAERGVQPPSLNDLLGAIGSSLSESLPEPVVQRVRVDIDRHLNLD